MFRQKFLASASVLFLTSSIPAAAQIASQSGPETVTVTAQALEQARAGIQTQLGASTYTVTAVDIQNLPGGDNSELNSVILQMPGVAAALPGGIALADVIVDPPASTRKTSVR